jgi:hypothetical protein
MLIQIVTQNKYIENFDLYSPSERALYEIRGSIMEKVLKDMIKITLRDSMDRIVSEYEISYNSI